MWRVEVLVPLLALALSFAPALAQQPADVWAVAVAGQLGLALVAHVVKRSQAALFVREQRWSRVKFDVSTLSAPHTRATQSNQTHPFRFPLNSLPRRYQQTRLGVGKPLPCRSPLPSARRLQLTKRLPPPFEPNRNSAVCAHRCPPFSLSI